ncbi:MAG: HEAT repeat domain-containing protein [Deltaproteobacteria bacterium]|nr:HEAT repeat domain-containing protein [Deltaproteobacteria bacterium]
METSKQGGRSLKRRIFEILTSGDLNCAVEELNRMPARKVVNPLFSLLYSTDQKIKFAAVSAMGAVVSKLADENMEAARVVIRRLMWNLNDESGGIGWGSPEAMGEILARHEGLAEEYAHLLLSYAREDGNYLEHTVLQRGLLWAIGRLAQTRPHLVQDSAHFLTPFLTSDDDGVRELAVWITAMLEKEEMRESNESCIS